VCFRWHPSYNCPLDLPPPSGVVKCNRSLLSRGKCAKPALSEIFPDMALFFSLVPFFFSRSASPNSERLTVFAADLFRRGFNPSQLVLSLPRIRPEIFSFSPFPFVESHPFRFPPLTRAEDAFHVMEFSLCVSPDRRRFQPSPIRLRPLSVHYSPNLKPERLSALPYPPPIATF